MCCFSTTSILGKRPQPHSAVLVKVKTLDDLRETIVVFFPSSKVRVYLSTAYKVDVSTSFRGRLGAHLRAVPMGRSPASRDSALYFCYGRQPRNRDQIQGRGHRAPDHPA